MSARILDLEAFVCAADVVAQLGCARSTAYEHLRRAARRPPGSRGLLRVRASVWDRYVSRLSGEPVAEPTRWVRPLRRRTNPAPSVAGVYFVQAGTNGPVKIGRARDISTRLADLQVANHEPLRLLGFIRTDRDSFRRERDVHALFKDSWRGGEWFEFSPELAHFVETQTERWK